MSSIKVNVFATVMGSSPHTFYLYIFKKSFMVLCYGVLFTRFALFPPSMLFPVVSFCAPMQIKTSYPLMTSFFKVDAELNICPRIHFLKSSPPPFALF